MLETILIAIVFGLLGSLFAQWAMSKF